VVSRSAAAVRRQKPAAPRRASHGASPPRRTQRERRETTRRQLLAAAIDCIDEIGFGAATLAVIAERAGVTRGAVQHHFGTRNELFLALFSEIRERLSAGIDVKAMAGRPIKERIAAMCEQYWRIVNSRDYIAAVQIQLGTTHDPELYPQIYKVLRRAETELDSGWVELFARQGIPPARVVAARHVALATLRGLVVRQSHRKHRDGWAAERALLCEMLERILFA
jgi:AcrR family transcriptional regulator